MHVHSNCFPLKNILTSLQMNCLSLPFTFTCYWRPTILFWILNGLTLIVLGLNQNSELVTSIPLLKALWQYTGAHSSCSSSQVFTTQSGTKDGRLKSSATSLIFCFTSRILIFSINDFYTSGSYHLTISHNKGIYRNFGHFIGFENHKAIQKIVTTLHIHRNTDWLQEIFKKYMFIKN